MYCSSLQRGHGPTDVTFHLDNAGSNSPKRYCYTCPRSSQEIPMPLLWAKAMPKVNNIGPILDFDIFLAVRFCDPYILSRTVEGTFGRYRFGGKAESCWNQTHPLDLRHTKIRKGVRCRSSAISLGTFLSGHLPFINKKSVPDLPVHNTRDPTGITLNSTQGGQNHGIQQLFLLICAPTTGTCKRLVQEEVGDIRTDRDLFLKLQKTVARHIKPWSSWRFLRKLSSVEFVQVRSTTCTHCPETDKDKLQITLMAGASQKTGVSQHLHCKYTPCQCLPLHDDPDYKYTPDPEKQFPPVPHPLLLECLLHPGLIQEDQTWVYDALPKKLHKELNPELQKKSRGWGICLNEGLDWNRIWALLLVILGTCILGVTICSAITGDWQSSWTVAGTCFTALTGSLGFFATL
ncbi:uncharacterized protein K452DRAFT_310904 [Aplosporella prunicola CBS 121167]|uniref:Uncharacterized protein n=1 Tax=Aplosporella prunicola CBS 121167 TaxID=1176127 RepID=A0A6A6B5M5_9PEZI|nr:uncharacterized protein K452DRAFT_310904 [Aplosporella prunicola CBS 121167]KAF2138928.1 hypothetical protein K452DRAFT_310904 [Aplosporella prunicola CBS 121167]